MCWSYQVRLNGTIVEISCWTILQFKVDSAVSPNWHKNHVFIFIETWSKFSLINLTFISFRNEENQIISEQNSEGKSWTEAIYSPYSWREKTKGGIFLADVPILVSLTHCKTLDRRKHPVSHLVYKVSQISLK